jgi:hypothetical protein
MELYGTTKDTMHSMFTNKKSLLLDPLPETPVWGLFGEGLRGAHFYYF